MATATAILTMCFALRAKPFQTTRRRGLRHSRPGLALPSSSATTSTGIRRT